MTGLPSRRALLCGLAALPVMGGAALAVPTSDLARACDWAVRHREAVNQMHDLTDDELDAEIDRMGAVFERAITEPSAGLSDLAAKARLLLDDLIEGGKADSVHADERLTVAVLKEVIALA